MIVSDTEIQEKFETTMLFDNCEAVTLKFRPAFWPYESVCEESICDYCTKRQIRYCLVSERGPGGNYHMHGIMLFPFQDVRKRFQTWFNKSFGHFYVSDKGDAVGWFNYVMKGAPLPEYKSEPPYLFDPNYEPGKSYKVSKTEVICYPYARDIKTGEVRDIRNGKKAYAKSGSFPPAWKKVAKVL